MPRYRRNKRLESTVPAFDIAQQWRHPVVMGLCAVIISISIGLTIQGFQEGPPPIASFFAMDVSESALKKPDGEVKEICRRYQRHLQRGDYQVDIWFADKASIVVDRTIMLSRNQYACQHTPEALAGEEIGQNKGTSLDEATKRISEALDKIPATHSDAPVLVTVVLDELDYGPTVLNDLESLAQRLESLAQKMGELAGADRSILRVVGPDGETATKLRQLLGKIPNARLCSLGNVERDIDECFRDAFQMIRTRDMKSKPS